ncbi:DNA N-6-adenine-methyltransferase [Calothrix sp. CCY 0018]|uniref:DNA N-6-adenine-methyltransferase n=1 Tax=Calothrix sp. CCY 0018 TaxID=3103864 RepID=UPI0039C695AC
MTPESPRSPSAESCTSTHSSNKGKKKSSDCWYTPPHIIELIIQVLGVIDLDPCADDGKHIPARSHFTFNSDGLAAVWEGRVFMNPPYSCPGLWMKKLCAEFESGRVREAIALVPAATDTKWLSPFLKTQVVCFWTGRIKFLDEDYQPKLAARQSHVLVYWGENWERFKEVFEPHGFVSVPSQFLEDRLVEQVSPFKEKDDCKFIEDKQVKNQSSRNTEKFGELIHEKLNNQSVSEEKHEFLDDTNYSSRKTRRSRGEGSGCIYYRTITKNGKEYCEAYYQYELWSDGNAVIKTTKYIPKRLLQQIQDLNSQKTPVWKILQVLSVLL